MSWLTDETICWLGINTSLTKNKNNLSPKILYYKFLITILSLNIRLHLKVCFGLYVLIPIREQPPKHGDSLDWTLDNASNHRANLQLWKRCLNFYWDCVIVLMMTICYVQENDRICLYRSDILYLWILCSEFSGIITNSKCFLQYVY